MKKLILLMCVVLLLGCGGRSKIMATPVIEDRPISLVKDLEVTKDEAHKDEPSIPALREHTAANLIKARDVQEPQITKVVEAQHASVKQIKTLQGEVVSLEAKLAKSRAKESKGPLILYSIGCLSIIAGIAVAAKWAHKLGIGVAIGGVIVIGVAYFLDQYAWVLWMCVPLGVAGAVYFVFATAKGKKLLNELEEKGQGVIDKARGKT